MRSFTKQLVATGMIVASLAWSTQASNEVICSVDMDRAVLFAGLKQRAIVKVTLDAPDAPQDTERPPVNLSIVLDRSGSMSGQKIQKAKEAALTALHRLGARDLFSLTTYSAGAHTEVPAQSAGNRRWIEKQIRAISTGGNTALFAGVSQGASEVRKNGSEEYIHRILLLSDGLANSGPSSPEELGRLGAALRKEGISVTTIGVGNDYNEDLMTRMAQNSDGNTYFVESSRDLPNIFNQELGDVLSVVASQVTVEIQFQSGIKPLRIIGRDGYIGAHNVTVTLNQLYGGQEKYALIEVELPASEAGEIRPVAEAHCSYQDMIANRPAHSRGATQVRFSQQAAEVKQGVNIAVSKEVLRNEIAEAQEEAVSSADQRDYDQAADTLRRNAIKVAEFAAEFGDAELKDEASRIEQEADDIGQSKSLPSVKRKLFKTRSFQIYNQQTTEPKKEESHR